MKKIITIIIFLSGFDYWVNPASTFYGLPITASNMGTPTTSTTSVSPQFKKFVSAAHYHQFQDATSKQWHDNGRTYKDWYMMRLAETYLLRAETYLIKSDNQKAAGAIKAKGYTIPTCKNKMPIPHSEIEANKGAVLEQNPGY